MTIARVLRDHSGAFWLALAAVMLGARASAAAQPSPRETGVVQMVFAGDVMLDGGPGHFVTHGGDPFAGVAPILQAADIAVANLECVIATKGKALDKDFTFLARPNCIPVLKRHFTALSLANNHSGDWGKEGFASQLSLLDEAKLPYFGGGRNIAEARRPLVLTRNGRRVALLGYDGFPPRSFAAGGRTPGVAWMVETDMLADVTAARTAEKADWVVVFLHWGKGEEPAPTEAQEILARKLIDAGADAVLGCHPHVTQTVELYRGRPIVYSLGNLVFDYYPKDPAVWIGWIVQLTFGKPTGLEMKTSTVELDPAGIPRLFGTGPKETPLSRSGRPESRD
jgi:poly-gamma-glutamate synthesis protein (capsule biosynthesis protein)